MVTFSYFTIKTMRPTLESSNPLKFMPKSYQEGKPIKNYMKIFIKKKVMSYYGNEKMTEVKIPGYDSSVSCTIIINFSKHPAKYSSGKITLF